MLIITCCVGNKSNIPDIHFTENKSVYFSQITALPVNYNTSYSIELYNWTNRPLILKAQDFNIIGLNLKPNLTAHDVVNISRCQYLPMHSACSIEINVYNKFNDDDGSFSLALKQDNVRAITIIKYFASHDDWNFDTKLNNQEIDVALNNIQPMLISIPIVFNKDYYNVNISHNSAITTYLLNCNADHISKAQHVCILQVKVEGGQKFSSLLRVTARQEGKYDTEELIVTNIVNTMSNFGSLLVGLTSNYIIANGASTTTLLLANNGSGSISNLVFTFEKSDSILNIVSNSCASGIASNGTCSIVILASNSNIWTIDGININYANGLNNNLSTFAPIIIKPSGAYGALNLSVSGVLTNTTIYNSATTTITISNTGALDVYNLVVSATLPNNIIRLQNSCSNKLLSGSSCQYIYKYTPTIITTTNSFDFIINGQYSFAQLPVTISNKISIAYSSLNFLGSLYTQSGSLISSYRMNPDYSFTPAGTLINFSGSYPFVVFAGRLLIFNATGSIATYSINADGSLSSLVPVTVSPAFNVLPSAAVVNSYNGYLYVTTFNSASYMISTYKCSSITVGNTISCSVYSVGPYMYTSQITGLVAGYNSGLIYSTFGMSLMFYTNNDGQSLSTTGPSTNGISAITADNFTTNMTLVYYNRTGSLYSVGYNTDSRINNNPTMLSISVTGSVTELFLQGIGRSGYKFNKPLLYILSSNGSLKLATLDNTYSSTVLTSNVVNFTINTQ
jgi:hypothetical protein